MAKKKKQQRPTEINQEYELVTLDRLTKHPRNPNQGDVGAIIGSIEANGWYGAVIAQLSTGHILAGNHRYEAARQSGIAEVPVIWLDVDDERAMRIMLADNRTTRLGVDDEQVLAEILQGLGDLSGTGYDDSDLADMLNAAAREIADDVGSGATVEIECPNCGHHFMQTAVSKKGG